MPAKVSAAGVQGTACQSYILNPVTLCDPAKCRQDCEAKIKGGVGTCYGHPFHKGCDCEYCPPAAASASSSSTLPRKLNRMN
jgi:hypothetical protein